MKLKATYKRQYKKSKDNVAKTVFVYGVTGTAEDLASYKTIQADNYRDDKDGTPLWFNTSFVGDSATLGLSSNGKIFADMAEFDKAQSMCSQYEGTAFGDALAKEMIAKLLGTPSSAQNVDAVKPAIETTDSTQDLNDL
jgi:hypothetical protein